MENDHDLADSANGGPYFSCSIGRGASFASNTITRLTPPMLRPSRPGHWAASLSILPKVDLLTAGILFTAAADAEQQHSNSLVSRRDWQELESGRSMEEELLAAAAPPPMAAVRARGEPMHAS